MVYQEKTERYILGTVSKTGVKRDFDGVRIYGIVKLPSGRSVPFCGRHFKDVSFEDTPGKFHTLYSYTRKSIAPPAY